MLNMFEGRSEKSTPEIVIEEADELVIRQLFDRIRTMGGGVTDDSSSDAC
jgi:hypothetical protein